MLRLKAGAAGCDRSVYYCTSRGTHTSIQSAPAVNEMNLPSREQCDGWDQRQVALFMGKVSDKSNIIKYVESADGCQDLFPL